MYFIPSRASAYMRNPVSSVATRRSRSWWRAVPWAEAARLHSIGRYAAQICNRRILSSAQRWIIADNLLALVHPPAAASIGSSIRNVDAVTVLERKESVDGG